MVRSESYTHKKQTAPHHQFGFAEDVCNSLPAVLVRDISMCSYIKRIALAIKPGHWPAFPCAVESLVRNVLELYHA